jgi:hypothetical protein
MKMTNNNEVHVFFKYDGDISVIYYGQDTSKNFGEDDYRVTQKPKNLVIGILKNIERNQFDYCTCDLCIPDKHGNEFVKSGFMFDYIDKAIKYYKDYARNLF